MGVCRLGDHGDRDAAVAWKLDEGRIEGVDVGGLVVALSASTSRLATTWRTVIYVDEDAAPVQHDALLKLVTGQLGGAFAYLPGLIGELGAIVRSPIRFEVGGDHARLSIGASVEAGLRRPTGASLRRSRAHGLRALDVAEANAIIGRFHVKG